VKTKKAYWTEEVQNIFKINGVTDDKNDVRKWDPIEIPGEEYPLHPFTVVEAISHSIGHFTLGDFSQEKKDYMNVSSTSNEASVLAAIDWW